MNLCWVAFCNFYGSILSAKNSFLALIPIIHLICTVFLTLSFVIIKVYIKMWYEASGSGTFTREVGTQKKNTHSKKTQKVGGKQ